MYRYLVYTDAGKIVEGQIDSDSEQTAEDALYKAGFKSIISLRKTKPQLSFENLVKKLSGVSREQLLDFTNELATLIKAGLNLLTTLKLIQKQTSNKALKDIIEGIVTDLKNGRQLHEALGNYPKVFSSTYIGIVKAGEKSGTLEAGLGQIAEDMKRQSATKSKIKRALMEPAIITVLAICVAVVLVVFLLPPILDIFSSFDAQLPATAQILMSLSDFLNAYKLQIAFGLITLVIIIIALLKIKNSRKFIHKYILKMPLVGTTMLWYYSSQICQMLGVLIQAGINIPEAVRIVIQTTPNTHVQDTLFRIRMNIVQGSPLSQSFINSKVFPDTLGEMLAIGESSGQLDEAFLSMSVYFTAKVETRFIKFVTFLEPALILFLGLIVGFLAVSIIGTLYSLPGATGL